MKPNRALNPEQRAEQRTHGMLDVYRKLAKDKGKPVAVVIILEPDGDYSECYGYSNPDAVAAKRTELEEARSE